MSSGREMKVVLDMLRRARESAGDREALVGDALARVEKIYASEQQSRDTDVLLRAILEHSPHGIVVCNARGKLIIQNAAARHIWAGVAEAEKVAELRKYRAFHPDGRPFEPHDWPLARSLSLGTTVSAEEVHFQRFDDTHGILLASCAPILGPDGEVDGAVSVFADIT